MGQKQISHEWEEVVVEPSRLRSDLWGYEEGDINKAYSADVYGESKRVRKPFRHYIHGWKDYVTMSMVGRGYQKEATAFSIENEVYKDEILEAFAKSNGTYSHYIGEPLTYKGNKSVFGLPVIFKQRTLTADERIDHLRRMYAYGGLFASEAGSYEGFLIGQYHKEGEGGFSQNILDELTYAGETGLVTQEDLRNLIEAPTVEDQLSLF